MERKVLKDSRENGFATLFRKFRNGGEGKVGERGQGGGVGADGGLLGYMKGRGGFCGGGHRASIAVVEKAALRLVVGGAAAARWGHTRSVGGDPGGPFLLLFSRRVCACIRRWRVSRERRIPSCSAVVSLP